MTENNGGADPRHINWLFWAGLGCLALAGSVAGIALESPANSSQQVSKDQPVAKQASSCDALRESNAALRSDVEDLEADKDSLEADNQALEDQIAALEADVQPREAAPEPKSEPKPKPEPKPKREYAVGQLAPVGDVEWRVTQAYPTKLLEDSYGIDPPKRGNFVVVQFQFANNRAESVTLAQMHMALIDSQGREFEPDVETIGYIPPEKDIFLEQVNPGVTERGMVIFTVAPDAGGFTFRGDDLDFWEDRMANVALGF